MHGVHSLFRPSSHNGQLEDSTFFHWWFHFVFSQNIFDNQHGYAHIRTNYCWFCLLSSFSVTIKRVEIFKQPLIPTQNVRTDSDKHVSSGMVWMYESSAIWFGQLQIRPNRSIQFFFNHILSITFLMDIPRTVWNIVFAHLSNSFLLSTKFQVFFDTEIWNLSAIQSKKKCERNGTDFTWILGNSWCSKFEFQTLFRYLI